MLELEQEQEGLARGKLVLQSQEINISRRCGSPLPPSPHRLQGGGTQGGLAYQGLCGHTVCDPQLLCTQAHLGACNQWSSTGRERQSTPRQMISERLETVATEMLQTPSAVLEDMHCNELLAIYYLVRYVVVSHLPGFHMK